MRHYGSPVERFLRKVQKTATCWLWTGAKNEQGYGVVSRSTYGEWLAHRASHLLFVGPIPEGGWLRQACGNRLCVNPEHLQATGRRKSIDQTRPESELEEI